MKTTYLNPLIPLHETSDETLTRLSANIGTLTELMNDAQCVHHYSLAAMFNRARDAKVAQADGIIALMTAASDELADDRRFLLVRDPAAPGVVPMLPRQKLRRSPIQMTLTA